MDEIICLWKTDTHCEIIDHSSIGSASPTYAHIEDLVRDSKAFEQQIHRIHELLEDSGVEIIWDDHIPDPDNPSQPRQIDITIRRGTTLTFVECRDHQDRQDVTWIEELIGRRASLRADAVIAVSASGFTAGALKKAKSHGIIPRDLRELTASEVENWGRQRALTLYFYQYSDLDLSLCFNRESIPKLDLEAVRSEIARYSGLQSLFNAAAEQLGTLDLINGKHAGQAIEFGLRLKLLGFKLGGEPVLEVKFQGKAILTSKEVMSPAVFSYGDPDDSSKQRDTAVEAFSLGRTAVIHNADRISVLLDISQVEMPPFCQFRFFTLDGPDEVEHEAFELVGLDRLWVQGDKMNVKIYSV
jgi:Restriction endonuclease